MLMLVRMPALAHLHGLLVHALLQSFNVYTCSGSTNQTLMLLPIINVGMAFPSAV